MSDAVVVAILSLVGTLLGSWAGIRQANKVVDLRLSSLENKVEKHNQLIERTYKLEERVSILEHKVED